MSRRSSRSRSPRARSRTQQRAKEEEEEAEVEPRFFGDKDVVALCSGDRMGETRAGVLVFRVGHFVALFVGGFSLFFCLWHAGVHGRVNWLHAAVSCFCVVNTLVCVWEVALWRHITVIRAQYALLRTTHTHQRFQAAIDFFNTQLSIGEMFSFRFWTRVWAVYSLWDPSYSDPRSYGFYIDIGNGHSMLLPSLLWLFNTTLQSPLSARHLGIVGIISFYQMFYGCVLYFLSFFANKRHRGKSVAEVALFVGLSNGIWIVFTLLGLWASIRLTIDDTFAVLL